jgi:GAF domain-containing protein
MNDSKKSVADLRNQCQECRYPTIDCLATRLEKSNKALRILRECSLTFLKAVDEQPLLNEICRIIVEIGDYEMAWIGYAMCDPEKTLVPVARAGRGHQCVDFIKVSWRDKYPFGQETTQENIPSCTPIIIKDLSSHTFQVPWKDRLLECGFRSAISIPLLLDYGPLGVLNIYSKHLDAFESDEVSLLTQLSSDLTTGITSLRTRLEHKRIERQLHDSWLRLHKIFEDIVKTMSTLTELRDPYTAGHQFRVGQLSEAIAKKLGFTGPHLEGIRIIGELHDIGKVSVPTELLCKPGMLNQAEFDLIRLHPRSGFSILKNIDFPWPVSTGILQHHERVNGSGYPQGLHGNEILPEARILAVADVVEAMSYHRPYRPAPGLTEALRELKRNRQILYDPEIVDACLSLFEDGSFRFNKQVEYP